MQLSSSRLIITYGIRDSFSYFGTHAGTIVLNDVTEDFRRELLTLVMADDTYLDALFIAEVLVIVHFARYECISPVTESVWQQEVTSSATDGHTLDGTLEQLVTLGALNLKPALYKLHKLSGSHRLGQFPYYTATGLDAVNRFLGEEPAFAESQTLSNFPIHAVQGIVHIGMHRHHYDVFL